jgi:hypothetical protein
MSGRTKPLETVLEELGVTRAPDPNAELMTFCKSVLVPKLSHDLLLQLLYEASRKNSPGPLLLGLADELAGRGLTELAIAAYDALAAGETEPGELRAAGYGLLTRAKCQDLVEATSY